MIPPITTVANGRCTSACRPRIRCNASHQARDLKEPCAQALRMQTLDVKNLVAGPHPPPPGCRARLRIISQSAALTCG